MIPRVSPEDAATMQASGEAVLVDIRDVRELAKTGKIADAVHAPRGMIEFWADPQSPYHKEIFATDQKLILVCASGWRSALAAKTLIEMGMDNVHDLEGGFGAWAKSGQPFITECPSSLTRAAYGLARPHPRALAMA